MHLKWSTNLTVLVAIIGLLWFIILVAFTVARNVVPGLAPS